MKYRLYVGSCAVDSSYVEGQRFACGLHAFELDADAGKAEKLLIEGNCVNPAYIELQGDRLYAGNEYTDFSEFSAYSIESDGSLKFINSLKTDGSGVCQISVAGRTVFGAQYWAGNAVSCRLDENGGMETLASFIHEDEHSVIKGRQDSSHIHSMTPDRSGKFVIGADLGGDKLHVYAVKDDSSMEKLPQLLFSASGDGPRHMAFSVDNKTAYLLTEISSRVLVYDFDAETGRMELKQEIDAAPVDYEGKTMAADIQVSPDGHFLYTTNRGADVVSVFAVDAESGKLSLLGFDNSFGEGPRSIAITPDGLYAALADRGSNLAVVCRRDKESGRILEKIWSEYVQEATCVKWG